MRTVKIFKKSMAVQLRRKGCNIITTEVNWKEPIKDVYIFEDNDKYQIAMSEIMNEINASRKK